MRVARRTWLLAAGAAAGAAGGAWFAARRHAPAPAQDGAIDALFAQRLPDTGGNEVALAAFRGRLLAINFWATWCAPCVEEMPELSDLFRELPPDRAHVIGIGIDSARNIAEFASRHHIAYPLLVSGAGGLDWLKALGNTTGGLPFTLVVGRDGRLVDRVLGRVDIAKLRRQLHGQPGS